MNVELNLYQGAQLSQQLNLAPQLLQWLRLLQAPTAELCTMVQHELDTNPALELDELQPGEEQPAESAEATTEAVDPEPLKLDDHNLDAKFEYLAEIDADWREEHGRLNDQMRASEADAQEKHQFIMDSLAAPRSLHEHLLNQLKLLPVSAEEKALAELMIGCVDSRGYLSIPLNDLSTMAGCRVEKAESVLGKVQTLDPAGVLARDLRECLLLQLHQDHPEQALAIRLLRDHADLLMTRPNPEAMAHAAGCTEAEVRDALNVLRGLQPEPGRSFSTTPTPYISPDVIVRRVNGQYIVELVDEQIPRLRLSNSCRRLLEDRKLGTEDLAYLRRKMRSATFLIHGIGQRQETLRKVTREIVRAQKLFFDDPRNELVPLTMASIAARLSVHETTVSRALANKHIETPRGIFEMRHFFRPGYACNDGSAVTPERVKDLLAGMMDRENPVAPLTDLQMARMLRNKGLKVARRTIAKYREEIQYPSSKERVMRQAKKPAGKPAIEMPRPVVMPPLEMPEPIAEPVTAYAM